MAEKETLLELRAMNWGENEQFEAFKKEWREQHKDMEENSLEYVRALAAWIMDNVYHVDKNLFTPAEGIAIYFATMKHSNEVREDEIKNWPTSLHGILKEADIAATAENSKNNGANESTVQPATTEAQM